MPNRKRPFDTWSTGVLVEQRDKILTITLNSPETLNAFTRPMHTSMSRIWDDVNDDPDVHVVVLARAGRAFSAGVNVIAMQPKIDDPNAWDAGMLAEMPGRG